MSFIEMDISEDGKTIVVVGEYRRFRIYYTSQFLKYEDRHTMPKCFTSFGEPNPMSGSFEGVSINGKGTQILFTVPVHDVIYTFTLCFER